MNDKHNQFFKMAEKLAPCRRDIWKSRQEAAKWLQDKSGKAWNKRVLAKYVVTIDALLLYQTRRSDTVDQLFRNMGYGPFPPHSIQTKLA